MKPLRIGEQNARIIDEIGEDNPKKAHDYFHAIRVFERTGEKPSPERIPPDKWAEMEAEQERIRKDEENGDLGGRPKENFDPAFAPFWKAYPRKERKLDAQNAWTETKDLRPPLDALLVKLRRACQVWREEKTQPMYIPHAASWLRERRWNDEI